jgi:hypothetical protein
MNETTLELKDIHLPEPVSWWPIAPGWWLLLLATILIAAIVFVSIRIYRKRQLKRDITSELEAIKQQYKSSGSRYQLASSLSILLRRAAISFFPSQPVAGLTGEQWLDWLQQTSGKHKSQDTGFNSELGKILVTAPYLDENKEPDYDAKALIKLCESWLLASHKSTSHKDASHKDASHKDLGSRNGDISS